MNDCASTFQSSKGDIKSAAKFLEMFVSVAEDAGLKESLADACSATGTMYNTMVRDVKTSLHRMLNQLLGGIQR